MVSRALGLVMLLSLLLPLAAILNDSVIKEKVTHTAFHPHHLPALIRPIALAQGARSLSSANGVGDVRKAPCSTLTAANTSIPT